MNISLAHYLIVSAIIFIIGSSGVFFNRKSIITTLMSIEIMLLAVNLNMISFSAYMQDISGQIFSLFILVVAAAETSIGLAILVVFYRKQDSISVDDFNRMKG
ncbi:NADH-quinone oxidoreductase subunit NuoK [Candidatus Liberibacter solanacearum]|uniref:NADH-quinone oxidoreductase subunit K n=1 Tax=Candidatus Liberibacter solanacearum TaxID=556287 RepID=A0A1V2N7P9_9HYPH|nr:NADH-quinone oxidoreductase subunit NuoK [Candidatus Liberibacter solanacearum]ONI58821.1 NADH-quinone oxidoreductase subunit K [Candidatus Liberibacter solanacearum]ONI59468.1 NADH-quinone oxidoreductase subunit K [Candidatus Liberibacter solanacearum]